MYVLAEDYKVYYVEDVNEELRSGTVILDGLSVIKITEHLDELINKYIVIHGPWHNVVWKNKFENMPVSKLNRMLQDGWEIYGAVWCPWGLKIVARMNMKGEFEIYEYRDRKTKNM